MTFIYLLLFIVISISAILQNEDSKNQIRSDNLGHHVDRRQIPKYFSSNWTPHRFSFSTKPNIFSSKKVFANAAATSATTRSTTRVLPKQALVVTTKSSGPYVSSTNITVTPIKYNPVELKQYCQCYNTCVSRLDNFYPSNESLTLNASDISQNMITLRPDVCESDACTSPRVKFTIGIDTTSNTKHSQGLLIKTCGLKKIFLGKEMINASDNQKFCCSLGMRSALVVYRKEMYCIYMSLLETMRDQAANLINDVYATGFWDLNQNREFKSCPSKDRLPEDLWLDKQPDNSGGKEYCTAVKFSANSSAMGYMDIPCDVKVKPMCQHVLKKNMPPYSIIYRTIVNNMNFQCPKESCGDYYPETLSKEANNSNAVFIDKCGSKHYYLISRQTPHIESYESCCQVGMQNAFIDTQKDFDCIQKYYLLALGKTKEMATIGFWQPYHDFDIKKKFVSCPNRTKLNEDLWALGQPDNANGMEGAVYIVFSGKAVNIGLHDSHGTPLFGGICQYETEPVKTRILTERIHTEIITSTSTTTVIATNIPNSFTNSTTINQLNTTSVIERKTETKTTTFTATTNVLESKKINTTYLGPLKPIMNNIHTTLKPLNTNAITTISKMGMRN